MAESVAKNLRITGPPEKVSDQTAEIRSALREALPIELLATATQGMPRLARVAFGTREELIEKAEKIQDGEVTLPTGVEVVGLEGLLRSGESESEDAESE